MQQINCYEYMIVIEMMKREKSPYFFLGIPKYTFIYPIDKQREGVAQEDVPWKFSPYTLTKQLVLLLDWC